MIFFQYLYGQVDNCETTQHNSKNVYILKSLFGYVYTHLLYEESVQGVSQVHMRDFPPGLDLGQTNLNRSDLRVSSDLPSDINGVLFKGQGGILFLSKLTCSVFWRSEFLSGCSCLDLRGFIRTHARSK